MQFKDIVGQRLLINRLTEIIDSGRVSHAQMLLGPMGYGTFAIAVAYVQYFMCEHRLHHGEGSDLRADSCGECPSCRKIQSLSHPDLHFYFPTTTTGKVTDHPSCSKFGGDFQKFMLESSFYATMNDWYAYSGAENKQGTYRAEDAEEMMKSLGMKSYEGRQKVYIMWMPELMGGTVSNNLLKSFEEPYEDTLIILVAESSERILSTVMSRVQTIRVPRINDASLPLEAEGNYITARRMAENQEDMAETKKLFVDWMRLLFKLKMDSLSHWVDGVSQMGRERQKAFLIYAMDAIRRCFDQTAGCAQASLGTGDQKFDSMFPAMITTRNVSQIYESLNDALYSVERNANPKVLFMYLSFQLSRHIKNR